MAPKKILAVEDDPTYQTLIRTILESEGYQVSIIDNGARAYEELEKEAPDLMLLDFNLPGLNGIEICQKLRQSVKFRRLPIVMLTVRDYEEEIRQGLDSGADDYMTKPFSPEELLARVKAAFRRMESV